MIENLKKLYDNLLRNIKTDFSRNTHILLDPEKYWPIVLVGERGIGKTYLLLQKLKDHKDGFYFSADNPLLGGISIFTLVSNLYFDYGIRFLVIDEIHKWDDWIASLKSIIDNFPDLKLIV